MGFFDDFGKTSSQAENARNREHQEKLAQTYKETADIHEATRQSAAKHAEYRSWLMRTGYTGVSFEDWLSGRYVVHVIKTDL